MQCSVKHRRCSFLGNVDVEQQRQSLFDVSIFKLQQEQMRHGVDPRLLRFVLINNALRSLQGHMIHFDSDECVGDDKGCWEECSDMFFYNTFKNGSMFSIPLSPPTPVKTVKADSTFSDQSPLVEFQEASPCSSVIDDNVLTSLGEERVQPTATLDKVECDVTGEGNGGYVAGMEVGLGKEKRSLNNLSDVHEFGIHLGKRSREKFVEELTLVGLKDDSSGHLLESNGVGGKEGTSLGNGEGDYKRACKSPGLQKVVNGLNGMNNLYMALELDPLPPPILPSSPASLTLPHYHQSTQSLTMEENDKDPLTPSPIDFANVDPSIYDFDTAVLTVDSTEGGGELDTNSTHLLPNHITITASTSCTSFSSTPHTSTHSSPSTFSPSSSSSASCSHDSCPLAVTAPLSPVHFPSLPSSSVPMQLNHCEGNSDFASSSKPHPEVEKMSLLSADSMVLTAVPGGSQTMITATTKEASCSMEALVHNGELELGTGEGLTVDTRDSINNGSRGALPSSPEPGIELDCTLDDIDHIVNLLMT